VSFRWCRWCGFRGRLDGTKPPLRVACHGAPTDN
jgi:hypothetical protein